MTVTRAALISRAAKVLGARVGTLGTVTVGASTTTAILNGLVNTTGGDNTAFAGWRLMIVSTANTIQEASVSAWTDTTGTATFLNLTTPPVAGNTYILVAREDYTLFEFRAAADKAFQNARRTYRQVIPITPTLDLIPLSACDWLEGAGDVDAVWINQSPLMLHNEDFSLWQNGAALAPDGYTLEGTGATIARATGGIRSQYKATVTAGGAAAARLIQTIPQSLTQWLTRRTAPVYTPMRAAAWVSTTDSNSVRVFIRYTESSSGSAVTTYAYSDYVTADGSPHYVYLSVTPTSTMNDFTWGLEALATKSYSVHAAVFMQNTTNSPDAYAIRDQGSQTYREMEINRHVRNVGGAPLVDLGQAYWLIWQLIVYCRRPFPLMTSDADVVEDEYARMLTAGLLVFLLEANKPNQDRARIEEILHGRNGQEGQVNIWQRALSRTADLPVPKPPLQQVIGGA